MSPLLCRATFALVLTRALFGCSSPPPPQPSAPVSTSTAALPAPTVSASATASAVASTPTAPEPTAPHGPYVTVIHEADIFGELVSRIGKTVTISSNLSTSTTEPQIGNKGVVYQAEGSAASSADTWVAIADVEVKSKLDKNSRISVTIVSEKKDLSTGKKLVPFAPKSRLRLKWEWQ